MMEHYLFWKDDFVIEEINEELNYIYIRREDTIDKNVVNSTGKEIIMLIDGNHTLEMLISELAQKYQESIEEISEKVIPFIECLEKEYGIQMEKSNKSIDKKVTEKKSLNVYPRVASLELTNTCNLRCLHCYGSFERKKHEHMPIEKVKELLDELNEIGVFIIELTGGECLMHPRFIDILEYALKLEFIYINILTNGISINEDLCSVLRKNRDRIHVQIDLHSLNDEYLYWFTGTKNSLNLIQRNIKTLVKLGVKMRIATTVTKKNLYEIEEIANWLYEEGVRRYAPAPVVDIGRAKFSDDNLLLDDSEYEYFFECITNINRRYENFIQVLNSKEFRQDANCGCLSSHVTIDSIGDIKICTMDTKEYTRWRVGNVFQDGLKNIYDKNQKHILEFSQIQAPDALSEECRNCDKRGFCSSCVLRAFIAVKEKKEQCQWYNKILDISVKELLFEDKEALHE